MAVELVLAKGGDRSLARCPAAAEREIWEETGSASWNMSRIWDRSSARPGMPTGP